MIKWLQKIMNKNVEPCESSTVEIVEQRIELDHDHDPKDLSKSDDSTEWGTQDFCYSCGAIVGHEEQHAQICNSCGMTYTCGVLYSSRSHRKIRQSGVMISQYLYSNDKYVLHSQIPPASERIERTVSQVKESK